jgi:hypothetical protein
MPGKIHVITYSLKSSLRTNCLSLFTLPNRNMMMLEHLMVFVLAGLMFCFVQSRKGLFVLNKKLR